eukprot:UN19308
MLQDSKRARFSLVFAFSFVICKFEVSSASSRLVGLVLTLKDYVPPDLTSTPSRETLNSNMDSVCSRP